MSAVRAFPAEMVSSIKVRTGTGMTGVWIALGTVYLVWGSTYLGIRLAINTLPPLLMTSVRFLAAGAILYVWAIRQGDRTGDRPGRSQWAAAALAGGALLVIGNTGVVLAEQTVPTGLVALLVTTAPLWMAILNRFAFGQHLRRRAIVGLTVGFGGVATLVGFSGGRVSVPGVALALLAPFFWAVGSVYSRHLRLPRRPMVATAMEMLTAGAMIGVLGAATGELGRVQVLHISLESLAALGYLIVFGSLVGFSAYIWLLRAAPLSLVSTYAFVNPVVAVVLGWAFLGEAITGRTVVAGAVIVVAVAMIVSARSRLAPRLASTLRLAPPAEPARQ